jgi:uncharacterized protein YraI
MKRTGILIAAAMLLLPTAALAAPGMVTATVSLRAGPGDGFPVVDRIPGGSHVNIHGCLRGDAWCDISWSDDRGWVSSDDLQWLYRDHYVYLSDYYDELDVPVVPFVIGTYWSSYYAGRPFFHRRAYFDRYWRSHASFAMRTPDRIARARAGHGGTAVIEGRTRGPDARTAIETRNRTDITRNRGDIVRDRSRTELRGADAARIRGAEAARIRGADTGRIRGAEAARIRGMERGHAADVNRSFGRGPQPMARTDHGPRFSAAPAARPAAPRMAQPNVSHAPPMAARAQMPAAPRPAAPAMARPAGPPASVGGGAAHMGGGAPGGPGRHH